MEGPSEDVLAKVAEAAGFLQPVNDDETGLSEEEAAAFQQWDSTQVASTAFDRHHTALFAGGDVQPITCRSVAEEEGNDCRMLWIDVDLSRFFRQVMAEGKLSLAQLDRLREAGFAAPVTAWGLKEIQQAKTGDLVGPSPRIVTACDMYSTGAAQSTRQTGSMTWSGTLAAPWQMEQPAGRHRLPDGARRARVLRLES